MTILFTTNKSISLQIKASTDKVTFLNDLLNQVYPNWTGTMEAVEVIFISVVQILKWHTLLQDIVRDHCIYREVSESGIPLLYLTGLSVGRYARVDVADLGLVDYKDNRDLSPNPVRYVHATFFHNFVIR